MMLYGTCKQCQGQMAILDILLEGYDLICTRCGQREIINRGLTQPPPCYQYPFKPHCHLSPARRSPSPPAGLLLRRTADGHDGGLAEKSEWPLRR